MNEIFRLTILMLFAFSPLFPQTGYILPQLGHAGTITQISFSPDGKFILSSSEDNTIIIWDANTLEELNILGGHTKPVKSFLLSSEGNKIVSKSEDNTFSVWDFLTGEEISSGEIPEGFYTQMFLTKTNSTILFVTESSKILRFNFASDEEPTSVGSLPVKDFLALDFDYRNERFAIASKEGEISIVSASDLTKISKLSQSSKNDFLKLLFSPNGKYLAGITDNSIIYVWDVEKNSIVFSTRSESLFPPKVSFFYDSNYLVYFLSDIKIAAYSLIDKSEITSRKPKGDITALAISPDSKKLVSAYFDKSIILIDLPTQNLIAENIPVNEKIRSIHYSNNNSLVVFANNDASFHLWSNKPLESQKFLQTWNGGFFSVDLSPSGKLFAYGGFDENIKIYTTDEVTEFRSIKGKNGIFVNAIKFFKNEELIAAESENHSIKVWNISSGKPTKVFLGPSEIIYSIALSESGKFLAASGDEGEIFIWEYNSGQLLTKFGGFSGSVKNIAFINKDQELIAASEDGSVKVFELDKFKEVRSLQGHFLSVGTMSVSPSGKYEASGGDDNSLRINNIDNPSDSRILNIAFNTIDATAFSGDSRLVLASSNDRTLYLVDAATGNEIGSIYFFGYGDWAFISSEDEYDCSEGALKYLRFIDKNKAQPIDTIKSAKYKPGILNLILF